MFVVLGAAGNTGKVVASTLISRGSAVRAVVTDPARGQAFKDKGAEVVVANVDDLSALERVFRGAEGAYVLLPPLRDRLRSGSTTIGVPRTSPQPS
jgi:NAD(P)H dehydrogenase (quinone)